MTPNTGSGDGTWSRYVCGLGGTRSPGIQLVKVDICMHVCTVEPLNKGHAWDIKLGLLGWMLSEVIFFCRNHFHSKMVVVGDSCVAFQNPFVERFDCSK